MRAGFGLGVFEKMAIIKPGIFPTKERFRYLILKVIVSSY